MENIVVIGAVATGLKAAAKARRESGKTRITVLEKGSLISYGACGMPYYVSGEVENMEDLMSTNSGTLRDPSYFKQTKDLDIQINSEVIAIHRSEKTVEVKRLENGMIETLPYDQLVIATGATPVRPPLEGIDLENVFPLWHPQDAENIRKLIREQKIKNVVIIGAGLIGIEMAEAFALNKVQVSIVEMQPQIFPAFLDEEIAKMGEVHLGSQGIQLYLDEKVEKLLGDQKVEKVKTNQREIPADLVILSIGVRPNVQLAKDAGLTIGETGAIWVDEELRTSDPFIFAGGDCVENTHQITRKKIYVPMGSTANKQGRVIGENLFGGHVSFKGVLGTTVVQMLGITAGKSGLSEKDARQQGYDYATALTSGPDKPHYMKSAKPITLKLIVEKATRKILGIQAIGMGEVAKRIDVIASLLTLGGTIDDLFDVDLSYSPPYNSPIDPVVTTANVIMNKLSGEFHGVNSIEAKKKLDQGEALFLDVRSDAECAECLIDGCSNEAFIPIEELRRRIGEVKADCEIIAVCKSGVRGYEAEEILRDAGFESVKVLEGGILAWPYSKKTSHSS